MGIREDGVRAYECDLDHLTLVAPPRSITTTTTDDEETDSARVDRRDSSTDPRTASTDSRESEQQGKS
jgi:hypothetical protein